MVFFLSRNETASGDIAGCTHIPTEAKLALVREMLRHNNAQQQQRHQEEITSLDSRFRDDTWDKLLMVARDHGVSVSKSKLKHYANQWKWKVLKLQKEGKRPQTKADKYLSQLYDHAEDMNRVDESDTSDLEEEVEIPEAAKLLVVKMVEAESSVLYQKVKGKSNFWIAAVDELKANFGVRNLNGYLLRKHFWQWKKAAMQNDSLNIKPTQSEELLLKIIRQVTISNNL